MNTTQRNHGAFPTQPGIARRRGLTIIELTLTLSLMIGLATVVVMSSSGISDWKLARSASLDLRAVYVAQKSYLADHPTESIASVPASALIPYLPGGATSIPTVESLEGAQLQIDFSVMPPVSVNGGSTYDPSGEPDDSLWDVGPR